MPLDSGQMLVADAALEEDIGAMSRLATRREVLGVGVAAALGTALGRNTAEAAGENGPTAGAALASRLKLSLAAYSFRQYLPQKGKAGKMTLFDLFDMAAAWQLDGIEPTSYYFTSEDDAYLYALKAKAFKLGLDISGTAIRNNGCLPEGAARDAGLAHVKKWVDHAAALGAPCIRVFAGNKAPRSERETDFKRTTDALKQCCDYAGSRGVFLAIENHGYLTETAEDVLRIVEAVSHEWFGVNLDTGNFSAKPYEQMELLAPKAINVQVKTEVVAPGGKGREEADFRRIADILRKSGYRGYVVLEYEAKEDPMTAVPAYLATLREAIHT